MSAGPVTSVDALGTWCPVPIQLLAAVIAKLPTGAVVELLADDPLIEVDLPAWCHDEGHTLVEITRDVSDDTVLRAYVRSL